VVSKTQRKNWNCLSPAQQDEFSNFSGVSSARSKMGKPASAGISNRKYPHRIEMPFTPPQAERGLKRHNKTPDISITHYSIIIITIRKKIKTRIPRITFGRDRFISSKILANNFAASA
jgi:hypothetical protein